MNMPPELSAYIQEFARPCCRLTWRNGGAFPSALFFQGLLHSPIWDRFDIVLLLHQGHEARTAEEFEFFLQGFDMF